MWSIEGDEFTFEETVKIDAPLQLVYEVVARVDEYDNFITDVELAEMESEEDCHMIIRIGPLRVEVRTKVKFIKNELVEFVMIEGPPIERAQGGWETSITENGLTNVTFRAFVKAGSAGMWLIRTASRYIEHKVMGFGPLQED